jgi:transposase
MRHLSEVQVARAVALIQHGHSIRHVSKDLRVSPSVIQRLWIGFGRLANMLEELDKVEIEKLLKIKTDFLSFPLYVSVLPQHETS